ncbi:MAG: family peptidase [Caulobacter sp.]|nr:family peptidase [Caulobacter sp.]
MARVTRRRLLATGALAGPLALAAGPVLAQATPPSLDELLGRPTLTDTSLSPDGRLIALARETRQARAKEKDKEAPRQAYLMIQEAFSETPPRRIDVGDCQIDAVQWANNDRLLIWVRLDRIDGKPVGFRNGAGFTPIPRRRVLAIDADGGNLKVLMENQSKLMRRVFDGAQIVDLIASDDRQVLMQLYDWVKDELTLFRVDVYSGAAEPVESGGRYTTGWWSQDGVAILRFSRNRLGTVRIIEGRAPGTKVWKTVRRQRVGEALDADFEVLATSTEPGVVLVSSNEGKPTKVLRTFDLKTLTYGPVIAEQPDRDISGVFIDKDRNYLGAAYVDDRRAYSFPDPALGPHFKALNKILGPERSVVLADVDTARNRFLVFASGSRDPGSWYAYDRAAANLKALGAARPWLTESRLPRCEVLRVKTRDGAEITAYLTVPLATGPRPLVIMPHGGPESRDQLGWDLFAQAFAAEGWLVLQPNFRGSGGYGRAFAEAGHRHWGDRMQEDVEDARDLVLASGRADRSRVAICGASYGGYAALMGAVRNPALYRSAVSIAGVTDLAEMLAYEALDDGKDSPNYEYWVRSMGDPGSDAAPLRAASPRRRAAEIAAPVLLLHGADDTNVPASQSRIMAEALKAAGKTHEMQIFKDEGHGGWEPETLETMLTRSIAFMKASFA